MQPRKVVLANTKVALNFARFAIVGYEGEKAAIGNNNGSEMA